jgi:outer membrane protein OmpA-like peptidoglycan-associated protein
MFRLPPTTCSGVGLRLLAALVPCALLGASQAPAPRPIRLQPGLVVTSAIHDETLNKDYESVGQIVSVTAEGTRAAEQWTIPDAKARDGVQRISATSLQRAEDTQRARRLILWHLPGDPETHPGATGPTPSELVFEDVRTRGEAEVVIGAASKSDGGFGALGSLLAGRKYFRGTVKRTGTENIRVLVDGVPTTLEALHAAGKVSVAGDTGDVEFWWLNDPAARLALKFSFQGSIVQAVRIDRPAVAGSERANDLQQQLTKTCRADVPGVYFLTDSAELLAASEPAVARIADVLKKQSDWRVTIEGHTDSTGGDPHNLDLSRRRAEALKAALVARYGIAAARLQTVGYGRTRPVDTNDSMDGRAHNRRVELARTC